MHFMQADTLQERAQAVGTYAETTALTTGDGLVLKKVILG